MKTAININTNEWRSIVHHLYQNGWKVKEKYVGYDASIDIDYIILTKEDKEIEFGWENWDKGEIHCSDEIYEFLVTLVKHNFEFGTPKVLNIKTKIFLKPLSFPTRIVSDKDKLMKDFFYFDSNKIK